MPTKTITLQSRHISDKKEVPYLRMSGNWLAKHGFNIGDVVEITIEPNKLIIKKSEK